MLLPRQLYILLLLLLCTAPATAKEVSLSLPNSLTALGDYSEGKADKPAVLILHGFLQTYRFSTVQLIASELRNAGYTVLAPTLTLNMDQRRSSLGCDAVHTHRASSDINEIGLWLSWLAERGHRRIILIGHSTGSNHLLATLRSHDSANVIAFIATSLGPMKNHNDMATNGEQITTAKRRIAAGDRSIGHYTLGFCRNNYASPADAFLSYVEWDEERVVSDLLAISVPTTVILGENDSWLPNGWADTLRQKGIATQIIDEANHYFSSPAEFDFQAAVLNLVDTASASSRSR